MARFIVLLETSPSAEFDADAWEAWAEQLDGSDRLESAELFGTDGLLVAAEGAEAAVGEGLAGYAVVYADDLADAGSLAALYPGLTSGDQLSVRPLSDIEDEYEAADDDESPSARGDDEGFVR
jgi:hypothetical protein